MNIEQIFNEWSTDCEIDPIEAGHASLDIPKLHNKYIRYHTDERLILLKLEKEYDKLYKNMYEYYCGTLDTDTRKELELEPNQRLYLKTDIPMYMKSDNKIVALSLKIGVQKEKIQLLDSIVKMIQYRHNQIKTYIDYEKFKAGA